MRERLIQRPWVPVLKWPRETRASAPTRCFSTPSPFKNTKDSETSFTHQREFQWKNVSLLAPSTHHSVGMHVQHDPGTAHMADVLSLLLHPRFTAIVQKIKMGKRQKTLPPLYIQGPLWSTHKCRKNLLQTGDLHAQVWRLNDETSPPRWSSVSRCI